jgi:Protein of unknown function (DUF3558)
MRSNGIATRSPFLPLLPVLLVLAACAPGPSDVSEAPASSAANVPDAGASSAPGSAAAPVAGSDAGGLADACGLLTDADIEAVTGYAVETRQPAGGFSPIGCQWDLDEGDPDLTARLLLNVVESGGRAQFDSFRETLFEPVAVPELGDDAVDDGGFILAVEGDAVVGLGYPGFAFEDGMAAALVEIVLSRL